jgi:hypothetical protein
MSDENWFAKFYYDVPYISDVMNYCKRHPSTWVALAVAPFVLHRHWPDIDHAELRLHVSEREASAKGETVAEQSLRIVVRAPMLNDGTRITYPYDKVGDLDRDWTDLMGALNDSGVWFDVPYEYGSLAVNMFRWKKDEIARLLGMACGDTEGVRYVMREIATVLEGMGE